MTGGGREPFFRTSVSRKLFLDVLRYAMHGDFVLAQLGLGFLVRVFKAELGGAVGFFTHTSYIGQLVPWMFNFCQNFGRSDNRRV
jgi:hypothetical protein